MSVTGYCSSSQELEISQSLSVSVLKFVRSVPGGFVLLGTAVSSPRHRAVPKQGLDPSVFELPRWVVSCQDVHNHSINANVVKNLLFCLVWRAFWQAWLLYANFQLMTFWWEEPFPVPLERPVTGYDSSNQGLQTLLTLLYCVPRRIFTLFNWLAWFC
jgi:hypothetical protein